MMQHLRTILAWFMVAVFLTSNTMGAFAEAGEHLQAEKIHVHAATAAAALHEPQAQSLHDEAVLHTHDHDVPCAPAGDAAGHAVCHLHAHCCFLSVFMPETKAQLAPATVGTKLKAELGKVRAGSVRYPLLRPPRAIV